MSDPTSMSKFRALFGENEVRSTSEGYYEWKVLRNPYRQGKIYLERKEGVVVGSTTITPKKISLWGKEIIAAEIGDTFTHPGYRRQGIFSRGVNACTQFAISEGIEVVYGTPNSQSLPRYQSKLGYLPCRFIKLNYMTKHLRFLLPAMKSLAKLILHRELYPTDLLLSPMLKQMDLYSIFFRSKGVRAEENFDIFCADKFTDEIDGLWGETRYVFITIRDETYLNWRYFENPDDYEVIVAKKADRYLGYVATKLSKNRKIGSICDFITINDRLDVFHSLIQGAERRLAEAGVQLIEVRCVVNSPYYRALLAEGYYDHGAEQPVIVFSGSDYGKTLLEMDGRWHFTLADSDNI